MYVVGMGIRSEFNKGYGEDIPFLRLTATSRGQGQGRPYSALRLAPLLLLLCPARIGRGGGIRSEIQSLKSIREDIHFLRLAATSCCRGRPYSDNVVFLLF